MRTPRLGGFGRADRPWPDGRPSKDGVTIYFNSEDGVEACLARVAAGGEVTLPRTSIGEWGFIGLFVDSEGNGIGVHGMN